jgi:hypothetical protein
VYGSNVLVQTDHKPLLAIMNKPISKVGSPRLRRLCLKLLNYTLELKYVPGKDLHFADMLSRNSLKCTEKDPQMLEMVHSVSVHLPMSEERKAQFKLETSHDSTLSELCKYYHEGWPAEKNMPKNGHPYYKLRDKIYVESGLVFLDNKIVVPDSLKQYVLKCIHEGHSGMSKSTQKARQLFYWPNLALDIQKYISQCRTCEKFSPCNSHEPLLPHKVPKNRYHKVATDILEFAGKSYLVIVDFFSHWLEVRPLSNKTSNCVIDAMQEVFTRFGYPVEIMADNNPFRSRECCEYYKSKDITIITSSPHYARSNGMAEKAVNIAKNLLKKAAEDKVDYRDFIMNYNNTPLSGLPYSPSQILNSRRIRTNVPTTGSALEPQVVRDIYKLLQLRQSITKGFHDRHVNKKEVVFKKGDHIVYKSKKDDHWKKGTILGKCKEPRSYWITKNDSLRPFRRNTHHLKKSFTTIASHDSNQRSVPIIDDYSKSTVDEQSHGGNVTKENCSTRDQAEESSGNQTNGNNEIVTVVEPRPTPYRTRSGRQVRPRQVLDY